MTLQNYLNASDVAYNDIETAKVDLMAAGAAAARATNPGQRYVNLRNMDQARRNAFVQTFVDTLKQPYQASIAAIPNDPHIAEELFMNGWFGFNSAEISKMLEGAQNLDMGQFNNSVQRMLSRREETRRAYSVRIADQVPKRAWLNQLGLNRATHPDALTLDDKLELAEEFRRAGVIGPTIVQNKPYM